MITTRRSEGNTINAYESEASKGGVALLERQDVESVVTSTESVDEARARMQDNLEKLLNYDRYSEIKDSVATVEAPVQEVETVAEVNEEQPKMFADEDIRPTSTTMQFGDGDVEKFRMDMRKSEHTESNSYHLNGKGKLVMVLYMLVVTVILTLIAVNSGVLASLSSNAEAKAAEYQRKVSAYNEIQSEIESMSSVEHIVDVATNEYGMIKG